MAGQLEKSCLTVNRLKVEHNRPFASRIGLPDERVFRAVVVRIIDERAATPGGIAGRRLNRDHVRAEVGKDHARDQPAVVGQVEHSILIEHDVLLPNCTS